MLGNGGDGTLFLFYFAGFQGFTDYRCFHVSKKAVTFKGVTKEVGVVECKPDAAFPNGVTQLVNVVSLFSNASHTYTSCTHSFSRIWVCRYFPPTDG